MSALTHAQVAAEIGKSENWVKRNAHRLPHHRFGRTIRFTREDLAEILASHRERPADDFAGLRPVTRRSA